MLFAFERIWTREIEKFSKINEKSHDSLGSWHIFGKKLLKKFFNKYFWKNYLMENKIFIKIFSYLKIEMLKTKIATANRGKIFWVKLSDKLEFVLLNLRESLKIKKDLQKIIKSDTIKKEKLRFSTPISSWNFWIEKFNIGD